MSDQAILEHIDLCSACDTDIRPGSGWQPVLFGASAKVCEVCYLNAVRQASDGGDLPALRAAAIEAERLHDEALSALTNANEEIEEAEEEIQEMQDRLHEATARCDGAEELVEKTEKALVDIQKKIDEYTGEQ